MANKHKSDDKQHLPNQSALPALTVFLKQRSDRLKMGFKLLRRVKADLGKLRTHVLDARDDIDKIIEILREIEKQQAFPKVDFTPGFLKSPISSSSGFNSTPSKKPAPGFKPSVGFKPSPGFEFRSDFPTSDFKPK